MVEASKEAIHQVVKTIASPLRFFAVAALALTAIVLILAWKPVLPPEITATLIIIAFGALIFLISVVTFLVIFFPKKLVFDQEAHLTVLRERLGDNELKGFYVMGQLPSTQPNAALTENLGGQ